MEAEDTSTCPSLPLASSVNSAPPATSNTICIHSYICMSWRLSRAPWLNLSAATQMSPWTAVTHIPKVIILLCPYLLLPLSSLVLFMALPTDHVPIPDAQVASLASPPPALIVTCRQRPSAVRFSSLKLSQTHSLLYVYGFYASPDHHHLLFREGSGQASLPISTSVPVQFVLQKGPRSRSSHHPA